MLYYKHMRYFNIKQKTNWLYLLPVAITLIFTFSLSFSSPVLAESYVGYEDGKCSSGTLRGNPTSGYTCVHGSGSGSSYSTADITCPAGSSLKKESKTETWTEPGQGLRSSTYEISRCAKGGSGDSGGSSDAQATCPPNFISQQGANGGWYCINENNPNQVSEVSDLTCPEGHEKTKVDDESVSVTTYECKDPNAEEDGPTCGISGIGWIVCPLLTFVSDINDVAYDTIAKFLSVDTGLFNTSSGTYQAWQTFRNLANGIFAILFLWIIFSQISNIGVSNYGIKKMLPRLIIGALLVNISFYLCQIAVDISNILGGTMKTMFDEVATQATGGDNPPLPTWAGWLSGALAVVGAGIFILLAVGIPTILFALLVIMMVFIIILARQALVVLLIAISPLAIAAWLLPNTEGLFKKWLGIFKAMLIVYPVVAVLFGAGTLASYVLYNIAETATDDVDKNTLMIAALGVSVVPLMAVIPAIKSSLNALGSLGGKLSGISKMASGGLGKAIRSKYAMSGVGQRLGEAGKNMERKRAMRAAKFRTGRVGTRIDRSRLGRAMGFDRGSYAAQSALDEESVKSGQSAFLYGEHRGNPVSALNDSDEFVRLAAMEELSKSAWGVGQLRNYFSDGGKIGNVQQAKLLESVKSRDVGVASIATEARNRFSSGDNTPVGAMDVSPGNNAKDAINTITANKFSGLSHEQMASQITESLKASQIDAATAKQLLNDHDLKSSMSGDNRRFLESVVSPTTALNQPSQNSIPAQPSTPNSGRRQPIGRTGPSPRFRRR